MKRPQFLLCLLTLSLLLGGCTGRSRQFTLKGKFNHLKQGQFLVYSHAPQWGSLDTVFVEDGTFSFSHSLSDTMLIQLQYPNFMHTVIVAIPGNTAQIKGDANNLSRLSVTGSEENDLLTDFRHSIIGKNDKEVFKMAEAFCKEHAASFASLAVLQEYFLNADSLRLNTIERLFKIMQKAAPDRTQLNMVRTQLGGLLLCCPGKKLPAFSAVTADGKKISQKDFKEKWTLIQIWSTWSAEFYKPLSQTRHTIKKYSNRLQQLNVCLDIDTLVGKRIARQDSISGYNVYDQKGWDSPLVRTFGVRNLPANLLVDPKGIIVARDIRAEHMEATLKKYLK